MAITWNRECCMIFSIIRARSSGASRTQLWAEAKRVGNGRAYYNDAPRMTGDHNVAMSPRDPKLAIFVVVSTHLVGVPAILVLWAASRYRPRAAFAAVNNRRMRSPDSVASERLSLLRSH